MNKSNHSETKGQLTRTPRATGIVKATGGNPIPHVLGRHKTATVRTGAGSQRQFNAATGKYVNRLPADGVVKVQGRPGGAPARRCPKLTASPPPGTPSVDRTVKVAPGPSTDPALPSPHDPMDFGWRRSTRGADLAAINERQAQLRSVVVGLPFEVAVAELLLSSVRHAVDCLPEVEVADALATVAAKIMYADHKWIDLYVSIVEEFKSDNDQYILDSRIVW